MKKIILYAGSSKGTNEISHLDILETAIEKKKINGVKVIYRPHPWGSGGKNGGEIIKRKWNNIIIDISMTKYLRKVSKGNNSKFLSDYKDTHDILSNVDAVISPLSTILIEATIHGKPTLCFLPFADKSIHMLIETEFIHFKEYVKNENFLKAYGYNDFLPKVNKLLEMTEIKDIDKVLKKQSEYFVEKHNLPYSKKIL